MSTARKFSHVIEEWDNNELASSDPDGARPMAMTPPNQPCSSRLPKRDIESYKARLSRWQSPAAFISLAEELMNKLGSDQFFGDPRLPFARDGWVGARLASISSADAVRLCPDDWPDYEDQSSAGIVQYEITEADVPRRRRGDEYKKALASGSPEVEHDPVENWIARAEKAPQALREAAEKKAAKGYPVSARLVIYLNISEYGIRTREIEAAMSEAAAPAKDAFQQVSVLWKLRLYSLFEGGERSTTVVLLPNSGEV